jgi:Glyoxalase/Bleomycin resistance protein/Dioxygenase superfamily
VTGVLMSATAPRNRRIYEARGLRVVAGDMTEFEELEGCVTCLRSICFEVDDLQAAVDGLAANGYGLVGGIGQHENTWRMAHARGPEGIVVSPTERID